MNKFLGIVLVVCLAAEVSAIDLKCLGLKSAKSVDFKGLDKYLAKSLADNDNQEVNLAHLRGNLDGLDAGIKKAGELSLGLVEKAQHCDNDLLAILTEFELAKFNELRTKRIGKLITPSLVKATEACAKFVEDNYRTADEGLAWFVSGFKPLNFYSPHASIESAAYKLKKLTREDPEVQFYKPDPVTGKRKSNKDKKMFEDALNKYILEPCKALLDSNQLANHLLALTLADSRIDVTNIQKGYRTYRTRYPAEYSPENVMARLQALDWEKQACSSLLNMEPSRKDRMFEAIFDEIRS